jgi:CRP-like cAMP-binding protein
VKLAADYGRPVPGAPGIRIGIKLSQRDLSNLVASSRESVNKQLKVWRDAGTIDLVDNHLIILRQKDLEALYA